MTIIERFKTDLKTHNVNYETMEIDNIKMEFYFKEKNYIVFIIDPNIYNEATTPKNLFLDIRKKLQIDNIDIAFAFLPDFESKYDIYINRTLYKLNIGVKSIYARACEVKEITSKDFKDFMNLYHLQGYIGSKIRYGLFHNNELLSVMGFNASRYNTNYDTELGRFCTKIGYNIIGGASKIFSHYIKNNEFKQMICYSDLMLGNGDFYKKLDFTKLEETPAGFFWYYQVTNKIYNRRGFWKNTLASKLKTFDPSISAHNNMRNNGYMKVFNLGNSVFVYDNTIKHENNEV